MQREPANGGCHSLCRVLDRCRVEMDPRQAHVFGVAKRVGGQRAALESREKLLVRQIGRGGC